MRRLILLTVLALGATVARAENGLFYLGAGGTSSSLTTTYEGIPTDLKNNSWKAFAGVRPFKWVALEADYIDLGSGSSSPFSMVYFFKSHVDASAWAAFAVGFLPVPLPVVEFYGKAGLARWKLNSSATEQDLYPVPPPAPYNISSSSTGTDFAWGIGVQAHIGIVGARLEYEGFNVNNSGAKIASLSVFLNL